MPLVYRGLEVGQVFRVALNDTSQKVHVDVLIQPPYKALIRDNSVFWIQSGLHVDFSLFGAELKTNSFRRLITSAIQVATPDQPGAKEAGPVPFPSGFGTLGQSW